MNEKRKLLPAKLGAFIEFLSGDEKGRQVPLMYAQSSLGRKDADIIVRDVKVSSRHASIDYSVQGHFIVSDLGSANGTFLNGEKILSKALSLDEEVKIGDCVFVLKLDPVIANSLLKKHHTYLTALGNGLSGLIEKEFILNDEPTSSRIVRSMTDLQSISLAVLEGPDLGLKKDFTQKTISIGRVNCDLVLKDSDVSRKHALIEKEEGGQFILRDLASSNGTFVNYVKITNCVLRNKDNIQLGQTILLFEEIKK